MAHQLRGHSQALECGAVVGVKRLVFQSRVKAMADPGEACGDEDRAGEPASGDGKAKRVAVSSAPTSRRSVPAGVWRRVGRLGNGFGALPNHPLPLNSEVVSRLLDSACCLPARLGR